MGENNNHKEHDRLSLVLSVVHRLPWASDFVGLVARDFSTIAPIVMLLLTLVMAHAHTVVCSSIGEHS